MTAIRMKRTLGLLLCASVASLAVAAGPAAAEAPDAAPARPMSDGGMSFPRITGPEAPEEYPLDLELSEDLSLRQLSPTEVGVFYSRPEEVLAFTLVAEAAHDVVGATVPTTLAETGPEQVTLTVHHRSGNPAADGAPFDYPIVGGTGWEGGFTTIVVPMLNPMGEPKPVSPAPPTEPAPVPTCKVPPLRGDSVRAAQRRLHAAHCEIGMERFVPGSTARKGSVVKQSRAAGTVLAAGARVALKFGAPGSS
jgi:hypothetical protein